MQLATYTEQVELTESCTLTDKEANALLRRMFPEYSSDILSFRLNLERRIRKGEDVRMTVLRFLNRGSLALWGCQAALFEIESGQ